MSRLKFRRKENKYTQVYNSIIFKNKSIELTGLYTTIQTCIDLEIKTQGTDNEFVICKNGLRSFTGYKEKKFNRVWNELKESGYLKQYKIRNKKTGKWEYEYDLLEEADLTTYHSLIVKEDGTLVPNIPDNKLVKIKDKLDNITDKLVENIHPTQNRSMESTPPKTTGWSKGGYNKTKQNKVCTYVEKAENFYVLREEEKTIISNLSSKMNIDLFEEILIDVVNKNKGIKYLLSTIKNTLKAKITTVEQYIQNKTDYFTNKVNAKVKNTVEKTVTCNTKKPATSTKKNKFDNFDATYCNLDNNELDEMIERMQNKKYA